MILKCRNKVEICRYQTWVVTRMDQREGVMLEVSCSCLTGMQNPEKSCPSKSDLPEQSKQGNKCEDTSVSWMREEEEEDFGGGPGGSSIRAGSEYSYASSITDDDGYGTKAPGVMARLMGLNSLPTLNIHESYPSPFSDTLSLQEARLQVRNLDIHQDHQVIHSSHLLDKVESRSTIGKVTMPQKMPFCVTNSAMIFRCK